MLTLKEEKKTNSIKVSNKKNQNQKTDIFPIWPPEKNIAIKELGWNLHLFGSY